MYISQGLNLNNHYALSNTLCKIFQGSSRLKIDRSSNSDVYKCKRSQIISSLLKFVIDVQFNVSTEELDLQETRNCSATSQAKLVLARMTTDFPDNLILSV